MLTKQEIPRKELDAILEKFPLDAITDIQPLATSGNIAYTITASGKSYFLRLSPEGPRHRSADEILAEIELLHHLKEHAVPVILPQKARDRSELISWGDHHGYIREFVAAEEHLEPSRADVEVIGQTLGAMHAATQNYRTKHKRLHAFDLPATRAYFERTRELLLKSPLKDAGAFVELYSKQISSLAFPNDLPKGTIHEDLGRRHALWQHGELIAIIDFDRSYFGDLLLDLGQTARGWCFERDWNVWSNEKCEALLQGYQKRRTLIHTEKRFFVDAIKFAMLERVLAFASRFIYNPPDKDDEEYIWRSLTVLMKLIEQNRPAIEQILHTN